MSSIKAVKDVKYLLNLLTTMSCSTIHCLLSLVCLLAVTILSTSASAIQTPQYSPLWDQIATKIKSSSKRYQEQAARSSINLKSIMPKSYMVPMRDGVKLYTVVWVPPSWSENSHPAVLIRSPYGPYGSEVSSHSSRFTEFISSEYG